MIDPSSLQTRLSNLDSLHELRTLFADFGYEADFTPVFLNFATKADEAAQEALAQEPEIVARAGEFEIIYAPLREFDKRAISAERLVISRLLSNHPFALWIFSNEDKTKWHFVNVKRGAGDGQNAMARHVLRRFAFVRGEIAGRTSIERLQKIDLESLAVLPGIAPSYLEVQKRHDEAFDVEAVTRDFFRDYKIVFEKVESHVKISDSSTRRLWTQRLFNRLMFLRFLERKGWLEFGGDKNYLRALFKVAQAKKENFLEDRLYWAFFHGLNNVTEDEKTHTLPQLRAIRGDVPFLNGGLFDLEDHYDERGVVKLPNEVFAPILTLFDQYNFTIHESTPFDVEIGIDPEMLGKVFEELITGRHESGSYYTPRGIVSFMGREALKGYLETCDTPQAISSLVDDGDGTKVSDPERVLEALRNVTICDPACGSGAYLLGMMQELLRLREALFAAKAKDHQKIYDRKLEIIAHNLYGVDRDPFAVGVAMLRLWLSLIIEFEGETPPPLPNLKYKIEVGDSLSAPLGAQLTLDSALVKEFNDAKANYVKAHHKDKRVLEAQIEDARGQLKLNSAAPKGAHDWRTEFAEVFENGGFDIVLANPPYVRQELIKDQKGQFKVVFGSEFSGTADLYVFFYLRAWELLRSGGQIAFISPNKWFRAAYGAKLRAHFAAKTDVRHIVDFGDLPVFQAAIAYPMIFIAEKSESSTRNQSATFTHVKTLGEPYPDVRALVQTNGATLPANALNGANWNLSDATTSTRLETMRKSGLPLGEYVKGQIFYGVKTGFNEAFVIDEAKRAELIAQDKSSTRLIKPLVAGRDIRRWSVDYKEKYLIVTKIGVEIKKYPAIFAHLSQWETQLRARQDQGKHWWELRACAYYEAFDKPKIICPDIAPECRFCFDDRTSFVPNTASIFPNEDFYLLGVLNSKTVEHLYEGLSPKIRGGYFRFIRQYLEQIPIPNAAASDKAAIESLVESCLKKRGADCADEEAEINARVAKLYGL